MKSLKVVFSMMIIVSLSFSWEPMKVRGQSYSDSEDPNKKVLKEVVVGAGTGAIAAGTSGGKAGKGALIGAGTNVIGNALVDVLTTPSQPQPQVQYVQQVPEKVVYQPVQVNPPRRGGCAKNS